MRVQLVCLLHENADPIFLAIAIKNVEQNASKSEMKPSAVWRRQSHSAPSLAYVPLTVLRHARSVSRTQCAIGRTQAISKLAVFIIADMFARNTSALAFIAVALLCDCQSANSTIYCLIFFLLVHHCNHRLNHRKYWQSISKEATARKCYRKVSSRLCLVCPKALPNEWYSYKMHILRIFQLSYPTVSGLSPKCVSHVAMNF